MSSGEGKGRSHVQHHGAPPRRASLQLYLEDLQSHSEQCLSAMNTMCHASGQLAETFGLLFQDTSLAEGALKMQEVAHDLGSRTRDASAHIEEDVDALVSRLLDKEVKEKSEEVVQVLGRCFLLMLQTQYHFYQTAADLHAPLSRYQELEDLFIGEDCLPEVREACSSWISASQLTRPLRRGDSLSAQDIHLLEGPRGKGGSDAPQIQEARQKLESQWLIYRHEIAILPQTSFVLLGGFHMHPQCLSMLLRACCMPSEAEDLLSRHGSSQLAAMAMGSGQQPANQQAWFEAMSREVRQTMLQVEGTLCRQTSNTDEDFNLKMKTINQLVKDTAGRLGLVVDVQLITAQVLSHACSALAHLHSQTAVQLLFGRAYVVTTQAAEVNEAYRKYAQVSSQEGAILVEVPSVWDLVMVGGAGLHQDTQVRGSGVGGQVGGDSEQQQQQSGLGACEVVYSAKIDFIDAMERRRVALPIIQVKLVKKDITITVTGPHTSKSPLPHPNTPQTDTLSHASMKRTIEQLVSKFRLRVPISKASLTPSLSSSGAPSTGGFYLPISHLEVQPGSGVSPGSQTSGSLLSSPSISSGSSTMSSNSSLYDRETPDSEMAKTSKVISGDKLSKTDTKDLPLMVGPTVTITSEPSPVEEKNHWETSIIKQHDLTRTKRGLASDTVLQDLVNLLSGVRARTSLPSHLDPPSTQGKPAHHDSVTRTSSSSSTSSQGGGAGGWGGENGSHLSRFGNFNLPPFQDGDLIDRVLEQQGSLWSMQFPQQPSPQQQQQQQQPLPHQPHQHQQQLVGDVVQRGMPNVDNNNEADFAHYVASNTLGKRSKRYSDNLNVVGQQLQTHSPQLSPRPQQKQQQQWSVGSVREEGPMSRTWPSSEALGDKNDNLNNTWSNPAHDSGSSSDEASNSGENPGSLMSMVHSSPGGACLLAPVSRRHSSGEDTLHGKPFCPSPEPSMHYLEVVPMDKNSTKTWPPKMLWQRPGSPQSPGMGGGSGSTSPWHHQASPSSSHEHLNVHAPLTPQWSDPLSLRQPSVWAPSSTPVSPSGSLSAIPTSSTATSHSQGASPNLPIRGHPKLDRRYAYFQQ